MSCLSLANDGIPTFKSQVLTTFILIPCMHYILLHWRWLYFCFANANVWIKYSGLQEETAIIGFCTVVKTKI